MLIGIEGNFLRAFKRLDNAKRFTPVLILAVLIVLVFTFTPASGAIFDVQRSNLSNSAGVNSQIPQIAASGNNVYVVWQEGDDIFYTNSTDGGISFGSPINLSNSPGINSQQPQISVSGNNVFVVWKEGTVNPDIFLRNSTDNGITFNAALQISSTAVATSQDPEIASSGNSIYVVWREGTDIFFTNSTSGGPFGAPRDLNSAVAPTVRTPQIAVSGNNIYTVWRENSNIVFSRSTDNGHTFPASPTNIGLTGGTLSPGQQIVAVGSHVYVIWQNGTNIAFTNSTDNGASFSSPISLGSIGVSTTPNQQIAVSGSNVYVVWQSGDDISFIRSTNDGSTFVPLINLSNTPGVTSILPEVATSGSNVYVVWREDNAGNVNDKRIFFKSSTDFGATFGSVVDLTGTTISSNQPDMTATGNRVYVSWWEEPVFNGGNGEIRFSAGTASSISITFNATQYKLSSTAIVSVTDTASNLDPNTAETIIANVTSTSHPTGILLTLHETDVNTGVFNGTMKFTTGASSGTALQSSTGDTITAAFANVTGTATIFTRSIAFDSNPFDRGSIAHITVTDQNSNLNPTVAETIPVTITSQEAGDSTTLTLTETGVNTGIFGGVNGSKLIFTDGNDRFPTSCSVGVTVEDAPDNVNPLANDTATLTVKSTSDPVGILLPVTENGTNTNIFKGNLVLTTGASVAAKSIKVAAGDFLHVTRGSFTSNALIIPNHDLSVGLLEVKITGGLAETITASFGGKSGISTVAFTAGEPGGGGGGIVRPGLVLNLLAGLSAMGGGGYVAPTLSLNSLAAVQGALPDNIREMVLNQDPFKPITPLDEQLFDFPFVLDGGGYVLGGHTNTIVTKTETVGVPVEVKLNIPATFLEHVALYTNLHGSVTDVDKSDTYIIYDKDKPLQIVDPHGYFAHVTLDIIKDGNKNKFDYKITFAKPMETSHIDLRIWDNKLASSETKILNALQVKTPSLTATSQAGPISTATQNIAPVLGNTIDLIPAIKDWAGYSPNPISDSEFLSHMGISGQSVPKWVTVPAKYVVDGDLTPQEFETIIKYLASKGIIK